MPTPTYGNLKLNYQKMYAIAQIRPDAIDEANITAEEIIANTSLYQLVATSTGVPWQVIGVIHHLESNLNFTTHLHNGDPLTAATVHEPIGRPPGNPPFTWEDSAIDAIKYDALNRWKDWSIPGVLYTLEKYNGFGYQAKGVNSPYLWSKTDQYIKGKFGKQGIYYPDLISQQLGAVPVLKELAKKGVGLH